MNRFWNWCKSFFVKAKPIVDSAAPGMITLVEAIDPKLTPKITVATAAYGAVQGALNQKA